MDGRYPTEKDFDYYSDMIGTDNVKVTSADELFNKSPTPHNWDDHAGVMIVIGVLAYTDNVDYSLNVKGPT